MSEARNYHRLAMDLAKSADEAKLHGFPEEHISLSRQALDMESQAAYLLITKFEAEPTRSVLFRSAATLAKNLGLFEEAKRLIYFGLAGNPFIEIEAELKSLLDEVNFAIALNNQGSGRYDQDSYINALRETAISLKLKPKDDRFAQAVPLDSIIDFLQNIQKSYSNYFEVNYRKQFPNVRDDEEYESKVSKLKHETKAFCVGLEFKSFGVSIAADTGIMNYFDLLKQDSSNFRRSLFVNFKEEVLYPNLESEEFQEFISKKYTPDEQAKIFSPIVDSLKEKASYTVSITDPTFREIIKKFKPVSRYTELYYRGYFNKATPAGESVKLERRFDVVVGNKKQLVSKDTLDHGTWRWTINSPETVGKHILYFNNPYDVIIVFDTDHLSINDEFLQISLSSIDYTEIKKLYLKEVLRRYIQLAEKTDRDIEEEKLFDAYTSVAMIG